MSISELLSQLLPVELTVRVTEALGLLTSLDKITLPTMSATGDVFEHVR